jgi:hypothetical protein
VPIAADSLPGDAQKSDCPHPTRSDLREWFVRLESGPAFLRCEERANWLADEHGISHGYANAIVHEWEMRRRLRLNSA